MAQAIDHPKALPSALTCDPTRPMSQNEIVFHADPCPLFAASRRIDGLLSVRYVARRAKISAQGKSNSSGSDLYPV